MGAPIYVPLHRDTMSGVLRAKAETKRNSARTNTRKSDEADARDGVFAYDLGSKRRRKNSRQRVWRDAVVDEQTALDESFNRRELHECAMLDRVRRL
jgi:hypothetical protein